MYEISFKIMRGGDGEESTDFGSYRIVHKMIMLEAGQWALEVPYAILCIILSLRSCS